MLAHELRRRMAALRVVGEVIATRRGRGDDDLDRMLGLLTGELEDLDRLAREVLREARDPGGAEQAADVVAAVRAAARTVATARRVEVVVRAPEGPVPVRASATMLRQAVENLLDNAARYADAGPVEVDVQTAAQGGQVDVVVADRGPGPEGSGEPRRGAPVGREGSGEPRRGAPVGREGSAGAGQRQGNGLGLFLVRRFLDAAGGHAWMAERPGGGTLAGMRLPLSRPPTLAEPLGDAVNT
jgi:signal transduction histidine kinase